MIDNTVSVLVLTSHFSLAEYVFLPGCVVGDVDSCSCITCFTNMFSEFTTHGETRESFIIILINIYLIYLHYKPPSKHPVEKILNSLTSTFPTHKKQGGKQLSQLSQ